jgi:hypothetical protein
MVWSTLLAAALSCGAASAATINEPFDSPVGGLPSGFTLAANGDTSSSKIVTQGLANYLQLGVTDSSAQNAALYYTGGDATATSNNQFADFNGSTIIYFSSVQNVSRAYSLVLRAQTPEFSNPEGGYYVTLVPKAGVGTTGHITINKISSLDGSSSVLASSDTGTNGNFLQGPYLMTFSAVGKTLSATVFNSDGVTPLASVSTDDTTYSSGYIGLRSNVVYASGNGSRYVYFRNLEVNSVPEPAAMSLLLLAGGLALARRRRK